MCDQTNPALYDNLRSWEEDGDAAPAEVALLDITVRCRITSRATGGAWSLSEWKLPPYGTGLPLHWHVRTQKLCYLLVGVLVWRLDEAILTLAAREALWVRPPTRHLFFNPTAASVTMLVWSLPGGIEEALAAAVERQPLMADDMEKSDCYFDVL